MTHRLSTNYAKIYCNRTLIVKVIVENVVTFLGHGVEYGKTAARHIMGGSWQGIDVKFCFLAL